MGATATFGEASEITLFGSDASAVAYIADDLTIYLWSGEPVAYLEPDMSGELHVYGFNGRHLGWYSSGILYDYTGHAVGARQEAFMSYVKPEPYKAYKNYKPFKAFKQFAPLRPFFLNEWSEMYLDEFLMAGSK